MQLIAFFNTLSTPDIMVVASDHRNLSGIANSPVHQSLEQTEGLVTGLIFLCLLILNIVMMYVARDARARGMSYPVLWMLLVLATGPFGVVIYLLARRDGDLELCPHCVNDRMETLDHCPACGSPSGMFCAKRLCA